MSKTIAVMLAEVIKIVQRLPTVTYQGREYFIDWGLNEFRPVHPPLEFIPFDSELGQEIGGCVDEDIAPRQS